VEDHRKSGSKQPNESFGVMRSFVRKIDLYVK